MEYALEGHGYCWSRVLRDGPSYRSQPAEARARLDAQIDHLALQRASTGVWPERIEAPAELLASLHVRAPASPRAALALEVATAVKSVFDGIALASPLRITHCSFDDRASGRDGGTHSPLVLGAWFPGIMAEVARGDIVTAGVVIALRDDGGDGGARLDVISRIFRKVCENGAIVHELDEPAVQIDLRQLGAGRPLTSGAPALADLIATRVTAALNPALFARCVEAFRSSAADPLDHRGGPLGALLRNALPYGTWQAVMARFAGDSWTRWGLGNAVTAEARWATTFAEASRLERIGAWVARSPWRAYAELPPTLLDPSGSAAPIDAATPAKVSAS